MSLPVQRSLNPPPCLFTSRDRDVTSFSYTNALLANRKMCYIYFYITQNFTVMTSAIPVTFQKCGNWSKHLNADPHNTHFRYFSFECNNWERVKPFTILNYVACDLTTHIYMKGKLYWNWLYPFCSTSASTLPWQSHTKSTAGNITLSQTSCYMQPANYCVFSKWIINWKTWQRQRCRFQRYVPYCCPAWTRK